MLRRLDWVRPRFEELGELLSQPEIVQDQEKWRSLMREHSQLEPLYAAVRAYESALTQREQAQTMLQDPDMAEMARGSFRSLRCRSPIWSGKSSFCCCPRIRTRIRT